MESTNRYHRLFAFIPCFAMLFGTAGMIFRSVPAAHATELTSICDLQGSGYQSPFAGDTIRTRGIVHGDLDNTSRRGFFIQDQGCDGDPHTSDGIYVYIGESVDVVDGGDLVEVFGDVQEYYGLTEIVASPGDVTVISHGNPLPAPVELNPPFDDQASSEYLESLEGMRVLVREAVTVGPTDQGDRSWMVRADLGIERVFHDDPRGTGEVFCVDDGGIYEIDPEVKVGDRLRDLAGVQDYRGGEFCLQLFSSPKVEPQPIGDHSYAKNLNASNLPNGVQEGFTLATFNLANLFDTTDDPNTEDTVLSASEYQRRLNKRALTIHEVLAEPDIIALQEVENLDVLQALVLRPEIEAEYGIVWQDGPDRRGIDVALLYRTDRTQLLGYEVRQGCTRLVDGLGPDGNRDVYNPTNAVTCDTDNNGSLDGNRLFSRPPLVVRLVVCAGDCQPEGAQRTEINGDPKLLYIIANHWKSKLEDSEVNEYTLPRRLEQAQFVRALVEQILAADPGASLVVLGDLNDYAGSQPLAQFGHLLSNQFFRVPDVERYTYIYRGRSQALDHILVRMLPEMAPVEFAPAHMNADYPAVYEGVADTVYRSSDHDPLLVRFMELQTVSRLPLVLR